MEKHLRNGLMKFLNNFKFTFKLWKQITHAKGLEFQESDVKNFMDAIENVGGQEGLFANSISRQLKKHNIDQLRTISFTLFKLTTQTIHGK